MKQTIVVTILLTIPIIAMIFTDLIVVPGISQTKQTYTIECPIDRIEVNFIPSGIDNQTAVAISCLTIDPSQ